MTIKLLESLDMANQQIRHQADGSASDDSATWGQVQAFLRGLDWKASVRVASTANVNVASAPASHDGVTFASGDRFLLKNQTTASENGVYTFTAAASALTRATDSITGTLSSGAAYLATEGTANIDTAWVLSTPDPLTVGTTALTFNQFGGSTIYLSGNGILVASGTITAVAASGGGVSIVTGGITVDRTKVPFLFAADVGDGSSTSIAVVHGLGTKDVVPALREKATDIGVWTGWTATSTSTITLTFATAPTSAQYRLTVHG